MSKPEYEKALDQLAALLRRKPLTARAIAAVLGCCKPAAYGRLAALRQRGDSVYSMEVREGAVGPKSLAYGVR